MNAVEQKLQYLEERRSRLKREIFNRTQRIRDLSIEIKVLRKLNSKPEEEGVQDGRSHS